MRARIHVVAGAATGRVIDLEGTQAIVVGRAADVPLSVPTDAALSRQHAALELDPSGLRVRDLKSKHGVFVNSQRVEACSLTHGDQVQVGETILRIEIVHAAFAETLQAAGANLVTVRCACGLASSEPARPGEEAAVFVCDGCQDRFATAPVLPAGYELVRVLGRGAMGSVFLVRDATGELRAIKQILPRAAMSIEMRRLFVREATVQAGLQHPHIVRVFGMLEPTPGNFNLVMEFIDGASAEELIRDGRTATPALATAIGLQVLDGLAYAHARQIVHRDIKEANLMLLRAPDGGTLVKVADFGLAKNFHESGASGITRDGALGGTLPYMSNEQLLDFKYVKPPADIYALGATLYRLLSGEYPRDYRDGENWIRVSLEQPIVPLAARRLGRAVPSSLCAVIERALAPDVAHRYQSAPEMRAALAAAI